jgi:hypothetical protein
MLQPMILIISGLYKESPHSVDGKAIAPYGFTAFVSRLSEKAPAQKQQSAKFRIGKRAHLPIVRLNAGNMLHATGRY